MRSRESVAISSYYSFLEMNSFPFKMNFILQTLPLNFHTSNLTQFLQPGSQNFKQYCFCLNSVAISQLIYDLNISLKMNPGHQPERFEVFNYLPNQRAFTIQDTNHVFYLDRYGGWFDQHGNYYNQNAEPDDPPSSSQSYSNESDRRSNYSQDSDEYERQFGRPGHYEDEEPEEKLTLESVAFNLSCLQTYPKNSMVRVYFQNMGYHSTRDEIITAYTPKVGEIINVILEKQGRKNKGTGYFILKDVQSAARLINLQGCKLIERPLYFSMQKFEDHLLNPIVESELVQKEKPKYVCKNKQELKVELPKVPEKAQEIPWRWYKFPKDIFPKKSSFKNWMQENGLIFEEDFRSIEKIEDDPEKKYAKIHMRESTFRSINGLDYNGVKVVFSPLQL